MRKLIFLFLSVVLSAFCLSAQAQYKKNAIVVEIFGKSSYAGIYYQRYFFKKFNVGMGIGLPVYNEYYYDRSEIFRENRYTFIAPVYVGYSFGHKKSRLSSELGIISGLDKEDHNVDLFGSMPFFSLGYEIRGEKYFFNIPLYFYNRKLSRRPSQELVIPFIGIRIGRLF